MLLAVDIGNTNTKFGVFDGRDLIARFSVPTASSISELVSSFTGPIDNAIICSVVPEATDRLVGVLRRKIGVTPIVVTNGFDFRMKINYEPLTTLGTDRLVNTFAAAEKYGVPCIVCSFGTATTIDAVSGDRAFLGGLIAPGVRTMARSLHLGTAQLGDVEAAHTPNVLNQTTETSIQAGIFFSQIGLVEATVPEMKKEIGSDEIVVATGGFASMIAAGTSEIGQVDENLPLEGLRMLHERLTG
jgi:type III pantothenate kinase